MRRLSFLYMRYKEDRLIGRRRLRMHLERQQEEKLYPHVDIDISNDKGRIVIKRLPHCSLPDHALVTKDFVNLLINGYHIQYESPDFRSRKREEVCIQDMKAG